MKIVRIQVGNVPDTMLEVRYITFLGEPIPAKIINGWENEGEYFSTLKDISIIMNQMVGVGVTWQLANELSKRLNIQNPELISETLFKIFREYSNLSDEEAFQRHEDNPKLND